MKINLDSITKGMYLQDSIYTNAGSLAVLGGTEICDRTIQYLKKLGIQYVDVSFNPVSQEVDINTKKEDEAFYSFLRGELYLLTKNSFGQYSPKGVMPRELDYVINRLFHDLMLKNHLLNCILEIKCIDSFTYQHSINVMALSLLIGKSLELSAEDLYILAIGALFHDIGKIKVPGDILLSKASLSPNERRLIERHSVDGYEILTRIPDIPEKASIIALEHHERIDGSGYPNKLKRNEIDIFSQIIGIADIFEAMTIGRDYRQSYSPLEVTEYLMGNCNVLHDEKITRALLKSIAVYRIGSIVQLNNKERGIVIRTNQDLPNRPVVRVLFDNNNLKVGKRKIRNLAEPSNSTFFVSRVFF